MSLSWISSLKMFVLSFRFSFNDNCFSCRLSFNDNYFCASFKSCYNEEWRSVSLRYLSLMSLSNFFLILLSLPFWFSFLSQSHSYFSLSISVFCFHFLWFFFTWVSHRVIFTLFLSYGISVFILLVSDFSLSVSQSHSCFLYYFSLSVSQSFAFLFVIIFHTLLLFHHGQLPSDTTQLYMVGDMIWYTMW